MSLPTHDLNDNLADAPTAAHILALHSADINKMLDVRLPYNRDRVIEEARFYAAHTAAAAIELGKRLILIKENEPHGGFCDALEELKIEPRTAQRFMKGAVKTANAKTFSHLQHLGVSKFLEAITLDDEDLEQLADGHTVSGLQLDDVEKMSVRELKSEIRRIKLEKAEAETNSTRLIASKNQKLDELDSQLAKSRSIKPSDQRQMAQANEAAALAELAKQATALTVQLLQYCQYAENCADVEGLDLLGAETIKQNARSSVEWVCHRLHQTVCSFGLEIDVQAIITPPWLNQASAPSASA